MKDIPAAIGKYSILSQLGHGGMGIVYLAYDGHLERNVAIKVMADSGLDSALQERFAREARAVARLRHRNIVTVHEFGNDGALWYIAMEYVEGSSLAEIIREQRPLTM